MESKSKSRMALVFREHPALLVSAFYVAASVVGMFYSWAYLRRFDINVFNYAQVSDFLIASLKEPFTWALVAIAVMLVLIDNASSRRVEEKGPGKWSRWYASPRYRFVNIFVAIVLVLIFLQTFADAEARDTKAGDGKLVDVVYTDGGKVQTSTLLATTGQFVLLYDAEIERVHIHPLESIHSISFQAN